MSREFLAQRVHDLLIKDPDIPPQKRKGIWPAIAKTDDNSLFMIYDESVKKLGGADGSGDQS